MRSDVRFVPKADSAPQQQDIRSTHRQGRAMMEGPPAEGIAAWPQRASHSALLRCKTDDRKLQMMGSAAQHSEAIPQKP
jgi:hypothetical protein